MIFSLRSLHPHYRELLSRHSTHTMPVQAVRRGIAEARNGVGAFILPCKKITFRYCNLGGSSVGMREYLHKNLAQFAADNRAIEIEVTKKVGHPVITGDYLNGRQKVICVENLTPFEISKKVDILRQSSGKKLRRMLHPVSSSNAGPRGIWSPFHVLEQYRHKV
ncbi:mitochondrial 54S ribosomal mL43 domain-containing protein [Limtongia smithiae]|uniref:mitochondrial 54S ribosomal mL43 domain-containing protein n=1 Tax=Limtongia smithiae TaxID=1125753 RepID=UPI0034CD10F6